MHEQGDGAKFPALKGIDHIHVYVTSRREAAQWYAEHLGFEAVKEFAFWATDKGGPLTIADEGDTLHLALFRSDLPKPCSFAFGCTGEAYLRWRHYFKEKGLKMREADHQAAWSIYITDPYGNGIELTTYDYERVCREKI